MKFRKIFILVGMSLLLTACKQNETDSQSIKKDEFNVAIETNTDTPKITPEASINIDEDKVSLVADLQKGSSEYFECSDGWSNGSVFDCTWRSSNCVFDNGLLNLYIDKDVAGSTTDYSGAEYRSKTNYGYGYYEVVMKPIKNDGVVSSFFTYTGPSENNPWDEIDIEFLGKDTTKVQFNYYTDGKGGNEYIYDLGFDAANELHTYGFEWQEEYIAWYVDGKLVYTAYENIPTTPGKIMANVWPGIGVDEWLKAFDGTTPLHAEYQKITYTQLDK